MLNLPIKILKTIQLQAGTDSVTFTNINTLVAQWDAKARVTSRHLVVIINARSIDVSDYITNFLDLNGDVGVNYSYQRLSGVNAAASADRVVGANAINLPPIPGANIANAMGGSTVLIPHAFNSVNHKVVLALGGGNEYVVEAVAGRWASVAAITSVTILEGVGDDFVVGSTFHLGVIDERYLVEEIAGGVAPTFDNIPQGEGDLAIIGYARTALAAVDDTVDLAINDDTVAANYPMQEVTGRGAVAAASQPTFECGIISAANATANVFGGFAVLISQYIKNNQPHILSLSGYHEATGPTAEVRVMSGRRANVEPINKIYLAGSNFDMFSAGSLVSLYRVPKRIIQRQELTAPVATVTFANIPQNFEALLLHIYTKTDRAAASDPIRFTINADAVAANYDTQKLDGVGAVVTAARSAADQNWLLVSGSGGGSPAEQFDGGSVLFPGYADTDRHKHAVAIYGVGESAVVILSARWESLAAITSIALTPVNGPNFLAGSVFELEGILRKEGLPPSEGGQWGI